jgi:ATP-dependent Zn protease
LSESFKLAFAYHEAGHAVVATALGYSVSASIIWPQFQGGWVAYAEKNRSKKDFLQKYINDAPKIQLAGLVSEKKANPEMTMEDAAGSFKDLYRALNYITCESVESRNISEVILETESRLDRLLKQDDVSSEKQFDEEYRWFTDELESLKSRYGPEIKTALEAAKLEVDRNWTAIEAVSSALLKHGQLSRKAIEAIVRANAPRT